MLPLVGGLSCEDFMWMCRCMFGAFEMCIRDSRKGDAELTQAVNDAINALIESGKAAEISEAWFGADIVVKG